MGIITKRIVKYVEGNEPTFTLPSTYESYRFAIGKEGIKPLVCIGMNPSAAKETYSDATVNKVIRTSKALGYDSWIMLNIYPERGTDATTLSNYDEKLHKQNIENIVNVIKKYNLKEVWGAWGDIDNKKPYLTEVKNDVIKAIKETGCNIFYFGNLTKIKNPRHPLYLVIDINNKAFL